MEKVITLSFSVQDSFWRNASWENNGFKWKMNKIIVWKDKKKTIIEKVKPCVSTIGIGDDVSLARWHTWLQHVSWMGDNLQIVIISTNMTNAFKGVGLGMGDNSIFSVFSNIWSSVRLEIPPQFQASWWQIVYIGYGQLKNDPFSFYLSIAVLLAGLTEPGEVGEVLALYRLKSLSLNYKAKLKSPCFFLQVTLFLQIIFVLW
jgi:hypothetical protein